MAFQQAASLRQAWFWTVAMPFLVFWRGSAIPGQNQWQVTRQSSSIISTSFTSDRVARSCQPRFFTSIASFVHLFLHKSMSSGFDPLARTTMRLFEIIKFNAHFSYQKFVAVQLLVVV